MRTARIKADGHGFYHCMSRLVDKSTSFNDDELEVLRGLMRRSEAFSGVSVLTYALMPNHFHILASVPPRGDVSEAEVARRIGALYGKDKGEEALARWTAWRVADEGWRADEELERYRARMGDVSEFIKTLKQRFSQWYNLRHGRKGGLWEERFKSVMVETPPHHARERRGFGALMAIAAYIDLNAVRAKLARTPEEYRWCGYGEAVGGGRAARAGLSELLDADWRAASRRYRLVLAATGEERVVGEGLEARVRPGITAEEARRILAANGELPLATVLRCRVRYFSDGLILGSRAFVQEALARHGMKLGGSRGRFPEPLRHADWGGLCAARPLRGEVIFAPLV